MVALVAGVGAVVTHRDRHHGAAAVIRTPTTTTVPAPFANVVAAPGTQLLTELVDPAQIAVPNDWRNVSPDQRTLPAVLRALEPGHPSLVNVLRFQAKGAEQGGVRLFAMSTTGPLMFVSVSSYASPGVPPIDDRIIAAFGDQVKRSGGTTAEVRALRLPAGGAIRARSVTSTRSIKVAVQYDTLYLSGRTLELYQAAEGAALPEVFTQIENSLRAG